MKVIAVFDIGKTNKKVLLFDESFKVVQMNEQKFETIFDDDGFECDDIERIENWIKSTVDELVHDTKFDLQAVNFSTYGASLIFLDKDGNRLTPLYNYLKEVPVYIQNTLFDKYGGKEEFCRQTASPALGLLLNSGLQILWLKKEHAEVYEKVNDIVLFPQYLSYLFTKQVVVDPTYIGCHSFLWDFDNNKYHKWLSDESIKLPDPIDSGTTFNVSFKDKNIAVGVGIHDSSASLVPYFLSVNEKFVLISTGTWCVSMNPFNNEPLTAMELENNCLSYSSINQKPVKSTMFFMGHIHDVNVEHIQKTFKVDSKAYKSVKYNPELSEIIFGQNRNVFFKDGIPEKYVDDKVDLSQFNSFDEAYYQFMYDITLQSVRYIKITFPTNDDVKSLIVSGGFARNEIMMRFLVKLFPNKKIYTSEVDNATALGSAMVCSQNILDFENKNIDLGLVCWSKVY